MSPEEQLKTLGETIPEIPASLANYLPFKIAEKTLYISGQLPLRSGKLAITGKLGANVTIDEAKLEAKQAVLNALGIMKLALQDLSNVSEILKLGVFVASTPEFDSHHLVANGASDFLVQVFGEKGKHARFAVGVSSLPLNACVEVDVIAKIK